MKRIEHDDSHPDSDLHVHHHEGSKELFEAQEHLQTGPKMMVKLEGDLDHDPLNKVHLTIERMNIPNISVYIDPKEVTCF